MKKFEYLKTVNSTIQELNELGSNGWELVNMTHVINNDSRYQYYIFKREING
jgi:hypothetical protein